MQTKNNALNKTSSIDKELYETRRDSYRDELKLYRSAETVFGPRHSQSKLPALWRKLGYNFTNAELNSGLEFTNQYDDIDNLDISDEFMMNAEHRENEITNAQNKVETALERLSTHNEPHHEVAEQFERPSFNKRMISTTGRAAPVGAGIAVAAPAFAELGYQIKGDRTPDGLRIGNKLLFSVMGGANPLLSTFVRGEISKQSDEAYNQRKEIKKAYKLENFAGRKGVDLETMDDGSFMGTDTTTGKRVRYVDASTIEPTVQKADFQGPLRHGAQIRTRQEPSTVNAEYP